MPMSQRIRNISKLTLLDRRILNRLQEDIPFVARPWEAIAGQLKVKEDFLLRRIGLLKKKGIIRRISAVFAPGKIKYASTLIAVKVSPGKIKRIANKINAYPEVTHNYRRDSEYVLWFTLVARDRKRILQIINLLKKDRDIARISELPAVRIFKINVKFKV